MKVNNPQFRNALLLSLAIADAVCAFDATIDWNDVRQRITGFGGNIANGGAGTIMRLSPAVRTQLFTKLFSVDSGAGLNMIRCEIWWTLEPSPGVWDWTKDNDQIALLNEAKKYGLSYFWSCTWSPPLWMKTIQNSSDGSLLGEHYQDYADYLSRYVREYKTRFNLDIKGISVTNEPHFDPPWQGCTWRGDSICSFIKRNLGPTFARDGVKAKIIMPETNWPQRIWADPTLLDTAAAKYADIVAFHYYETNPTDPYAPYPLAKNQGKELWETEAMTFDDAPDDPGMNDAMIWARNIHGLLTNAELNAFHFWWFLNGSDRKHGLCTGSGSSFYTTKRLWIMGNYSKFVRPGWRMMHTAYDSPDGYLGTSAFRDSTGTKFAIVVLNRDKKGSHDITLTLDGFRSAIVTPWLTDTTHDLSALAPIAVTGGMFTATLPPMSVTSFVGQCAAITGADVDVDSFVAQPAYAAPGMPVTLVWATKNATSVTISGVSGTIAVSGSASVSPAQTTTYTLTAQGQNGPVARALTVMVQAPREPENPSPVVNGITYKYYEGTWQTIPDLDTMTPLRTGLSTNFFPRVAGYRPLNYVIRYEGYISVPSTGYYTFYTKSDFASKLYIGTTLVVDNDKGIVDERSGGILLKAGMHAMTVDFHQLTGGIPALTVSWQALELGLPKKAVPPANLYRLVTPAQVLGPNRVVPALQVSLRSHGKMITLNAPCAGSIAVTVIDQSGRMVWRRAENTHAAKRFVVDISRDGRPLAAGPYVCVVEMPDHQVYKTMIVIDE